MSTLALAPYTPKTTSAVAQRRRSRSLAQPIATRRAFVDVLHDPIDKRCAWLGLRGFTTACIAADTGLTPCQVMYTLKIAGITKENGASRADFRNGTSPFAKRYLSNPTPEEDRQFMRFLQAHL